jgi:nitrogen fixation protein FixH
MVLLAVTTSPGLVVEDYYERGRAYAETRAAQRLARPEAWQVRLQLPDNIFLGVPASLRVAATDENGLPVRADMARLFAYRPSDAGADFEAPMATEAPGVVGTEVTFPLPGVWDLIVQVRSGERVYDLARRISVRRD